MSRRSGVSHWTGHLFLWTLIAIGCGMGAAASVESGQAILLSLALFPLFAVIRYMHPKAAVSAGAFWALLLALIFQGGSDLGLINYLPAVIWIGAVGLYCGGGAWFTRRFGFSPIILAVGWVVMELALKALLISVPAEMIAVSNNSVTQVIATALGYICVALIIVILNATLILSLGKMSLTMSCRAVCGMISQFCHQTHERGFTFKAWTGMSPTRPRAPPQVA